MYLGIDGGGTGCRAAVCGADGAVLGRGTGASANIVTDAAGARVSVLAAARAALQEAGAAEGSAVAVLGLAGANLADRAATFAAALPFRRAQVVSDALIAVRGALGAEDGVAAVIGTGSVFALQTSGAVRFLGGWGFQLGDQASGAWMGRRLLERALLAHDGLAPGTPLLGAVVAEAGGPEGLVAFAQTALPPDYARLARRLVEADDPAAEAVLAEAGAHVAASVDALMAGRALPLCFLGGLGAVFAARLAGRYGAAIRPPKGSALDGALALARGLG